ncbi:peptide-methionine (S)-S-oxide reductase MsrA [Pseudomonas sp. LS44]|uniref:peptide-methionine (S)-S-oxide reductase MsrA n=1 Tax=Pseudomonas sp. LS44 TaxID=1357074 RepID=UPI0035C711AE
MPALYWLGAAALVAAVLLSGLRGGHAAEQAFVIPPPTLDEPAVPTHSATAVFAGGCFWGVQAVFQHVTGVTQALSGYAGGDVSSANYEDVSAGATKHAEAVQVSYDPTQISYGQLLQIYFSVAHDPTQLNRQGPDSGTQYRSTVFTSSEQQRQIVRAYIAQLNQTGVYAKPLATTIEALKGFYPAEAYHQDYLVHNPQSMYIVINDQPKIDNLAKLFAARYRPEPVLVNP